VSQGKRDPLSRTSGTTKSVADRPLAAEGDGSLPHVSIYTDGSCIGNPGPGGYGVVLLHGDHRREISGGRRRTTNNRMELLAAIVGLEALKERCRVTLYSDSQYLVRAMQEAWPQRWEARGWKRSPGVPAANPDLWSRLLRLSGHHPVEFVWVRAHAGQPENERADSLANRAAFEPILPADDGYEWDMGRAESAVRPPPRRGRGGRRG
jgi:ribonuclease HI